MNDRALQDEIVDLEVTDTLDLHHFSPKDISRLVQNYIEEAHARRFEVVRIIHGKGIGVQRQTVRQILERSPLVAGFSDAESWGATIARLRY
jgi:dsDNA-specific endonuclease/ATPase MutS2